MVELPGGGTYTFSDYSNGGGADCDFEFPIELY